MKSEISDLKKSEIVWLAEHKCKHNHSYLAHFSCYKGQTKPTAVFFDTEVTPQLGWTYGKWHEASVLKAKRYQYIMCFSYLDLRECKVKVVSMRDFPLYKKEPHNDIEVVKALYKILSEYDYCGAHNIKFDIGIFKARCVFHGLPPIKKLKKLCTLQLARKVANFPANSLKELALFLGIKHKMEVSKGLWERIYEKQDPKAWREMETYCGIDTEVCVQIFKKLEKWSDRQLIK